ncbi:DUF4124 domain-containing protein [Stutzerimonas tarimensis]|uniref:DUF4124 domain-containing protein n=1 Tax=Stutzerimonas tarimensis TaxID=1507735 RepID=A0ABV7T8Q8_9GAMM
MRIALLCLLLAVSSASQAQIYRYTDDNGNPVFTNEPPQGVEATEVELPEPTTVEFRKAEMPEPLAGPSETKTERPYHRVEVAGIPDEEALRANDGAFTVAARLDPPLQKGHSLRFLLDGEPIAPAGPSTLVEVRTIDRGEHSLQVEVLSGRQVIQRSPVQTFTVQRVHTSSPAMRQRAAP